MGGWWVGRWVRCSSGSRKHVFDVAGGCVEHGGVGFWGRATQGYGCRPGTGRQALRAIPVGTNVVRSRLYDFHRLHITIKAADDYYMLLCTYVLCFCWFGGDRLSYIPYIRFIGVMLCQFRLREGREVFNTLFLAGRRQALPRGAVIT